MCFWGEAYALGSFLNGGMSKEKAQLAHAAIERAVALADDVTDVERDLIMAARVRYPEDYDPEERRALVRPVSLARKLQLSIAGTVATSLVFAMALSYSQSPAMRSRTLPAVS